MRRTEVLKVGFPPPLQNQMVPAVLTPCKSQVYFLLFRKTTYLYQNNGVLFTEGILVASYSNKKVQKTLFFSQNLSNSRKSGWLPVT